MRVRFVIPVKAKITHDRINGGDARIVALPSS
jgi:hypothetical protein